MHSIGPVWLTKTNLRRRTSMVKWVEQADVLYFVLPVVAGFSSSHGPVRDQTISDRSHPYAGAKGGKGGKGGKGKGKGKGSGKPTSPGVIRCLKDV